MRQNRELQIVGYIGLPRADELPSGVFPLLVDETGQYYTIPEMGRSDPEPVDSEEIEQALVVGTATDCRRQPINKVGCFNQGPIPYQAGHYLILLDPENPGGPILPQYLDETNLGGKLEPLAVSYLRNGLIAYRDKHLEKARWWWYKTGRALSRIALPGLLSYSSYWTQQDGSGIQTVAEILQQKMLAGPRPSTDMRKVNPIASSKVAVRLEHGNVTWEGIFEEPYSVTPKVPIQPWELVVFSKMLKIVDEADIEYRMGAWIMGH